MMHKIENIKNNFKYNNYYDYLIDPLFSILNLLSFYISETNIIKLWNIK